MYFHFDKSTIERSSYKQRYLPSWYRSNVNKWYTEQNLSPECVFDKDSFYLCYWSITLVRGDLDENGMFFYESLIDSTLLKYMMFERSHGRDFILKKYAKRVRKLKQIQIDLIQQ